MSPHTETERVTENNYPPRKNQPLRKSPSLPWNVCWKQQCFHKRSQSTCSQSPLKWECSFKCCWLWWGGEAWCLLGALAFLHSSFVQCLKFSLRHCKPLHSAAENTGFASQFWAVCFKMDQGSIWKPKIRGEKAKSFLSSIAHRQCANYCCLSLDPRSLFALGIAWKHLF